eukprot:7245767-Pyramimonas_sp.AAC.1
MAAMQEFGVHLHIAPTEDQAADRLLCQFVQRELGLGAPSSTPPAESGATEGVCEQKVCASAAMAGLVLISCDHGFAPMLTMARHAGVLTTLLLPVGYKQHTIRIHGACRKSLTRPNLGGGGKDTDYTYYISDCVLFARAICSKLYSLLPTLRVST